MTKENQPYAYDENIVGQKVICLGGYGCHWIYVNPFTGKLYLTDGYGLVDYEKELGNDLIKYIQYIKNEYDGCYDVNELNELFTVRNQTI